MVQFWAWIFCLRIYGIVRLVLCMASTICCCCCFYYMDVLSFVSFIHSFISVRILSNSEIIRERWNANGCEEWKSCAHRVMKQTPIFIVVHVKQQFILSVLLSLFVLIFVGCLGVACTLLKRATTNAHNVTIIHRFGRCFVVWMRFGLFFGDASTIFRFWISNALFLVWCAWFACRNSLLKLNLQLKLRTFIWITCNSLLKRIDDKDLIGTLCTLSSAILLPFFRLSVSIAFSRHFLYTFHT